MSDASFKLTVKTSFACSEADNEICDSIARRHGVSRSHIIRGLIIAAALPPSENLLETALKIMAAPEKKRRLMMHGILRECRAQDGRSTYGEVPA